MEEKAVLFKGQNSEALGIVKHASLIAKIFKKYEIFTQKIKMSEGTEALLKL